METLQKPIQSKFKTLVLVTATLSFSLIMLMVRMKLNKSFFYLFLVWNIFLAFIPYIITMYLNTKTNLSKLKLGFWFFIWLALLPNAPYIVTDLIHIRIGNHTLLWLDVMVILSFALSGLLLFYLSIRDMEKLIAVKFKQIPITTLSILIMFLCGFGVYLGRFLRYNSWEIISNPEVLISDVFNIIVSPFQNSGAWLFTLGFGGFLVVGYLIFKNIIYSKNVT
ncbi:DUF1361 domain-containing protein [Winogradskyella echinorum]|uniref:DUF1361 domain-containing protein n=1 Tax=Winogradskyella echinorum TaxID=538189 RepID=A0ABR6XWI6_9FLAO|nr:DUF1361 domain-containing protein [Winogradskyella echinorum]MBC3844846.1 DUF1361 domain-containing protein [Winogradskyella echinorum]MBC5749194.1 DUF1361 domain-containing protein [Winogradskyella echinorum]